MIRHSPKLLASEEKVTRNVETLQARFQAQHREVGCQSSSECAWHCSVTAARPEWPTSNACDTDQRSGQGYSSYEAIICRRPMTSCWRKLPVARVTHKLSGKELRVYSISTYFLNIRPIFSPSDVTYWIGRASKINYLLKALVDTSYY